MEKTDILRKNFQKSLIASKRYEISINEIRFHIFIHKAKH